MFKLLSFFNTKEGPEVVAPISVIKEVPGDHVRFRNDIYGEYLKAKEECEHAENRVNNADSNYADAAMLGLFAARARREALLREIKEIKEEVTI